MAGNGRDLVRGAARLRQAARSGLTEPVGAAMRQVRHVTLFAKPLAKVARRERPVELISQEGQMVGRRLGDNSSKCRVNRNPKVDARFLLADSQYPVADMLRPHPHNV
jgi:hypothetical protein